MRLYPLRDEAILQEVGVYNYRHPMESANDYKEALSSLRREIKDSVKSDRAVSTTDTTWTVNESKSQGRKIDPRYIKVALACLQQ